MVIGVNYLCEFVIDWGYQYYCIVWLGEGIDIQCCVVYQIMYCYDLVGLYLLVVMVLYLLVDCVGIGCIVVWIVIDFMLCYSFDRVLYYGGWVEIYVCYLYWDVVCWIDVIVFLYVVLF